MKSFARERYYALNTCAQRLIKNAIYLAFFPFILTKFSISRSYVKEWHGDKKNEKGKKERTNLYVDKE